MLPLKDQIPVQNIRKDISVFYTKNWKELVIITTETRTQNF